MQSKKIKLILTGICLFFALSLTFMRLIKPTYNQSLNTGIKINADTELKSQSTNEGDIEPMNKPAYFNIFKFIVSFLPVHSNQE